MSPETALVSAALGLFIGPILLLALGRRAWWLEFVDGYILFSVGGISLMHLLPKSLVDGGVWAGVAAALGLFLPYFLEKKFVTAHGKVLVLLLLGLLLHAAFDGAALALPTADDHGHLQFAVLLHRLPVGLVVFWAVSERQPIWQAFGMVSLLAVATLLGYASASPLQAVSTSSAVALFEAFVVGALLHVVVHTQTLVCGHPHGHDSHDEVTAILPRAMSFLGAALGVLTVLELEHGAELLPSAEGSLQVLPTLRALALTMAPALLAAYVLISILTALFSASAMKLLSGGSHLSHGFKGVFYGWSSRVSTCDVLSRYTLLVKAGVPATIALAFLLGTTGVALEALMVSVPLLGEFLAGSRFVAAVLVALIVAWTVGQSLPPRGVKIALDPPEDRGWGQRFNHGVRYGLGELVDHTLPWVVLGLGVAAFTEPLLEPMTSPSPEAWGIVRSIPTAAHVPLMAALGFPIYICGAGATVMAAIILHKGVSAGAVLAFLLLAPVLNTTAMSVITRLHGRGTTIRVGAIAFVVAVWIGWFVDMVFGGGGFDLAARSQAEAGVIEELCVGGLGLLVAVSLVRQGLRGFLGQIFHPHHTHESASEHSH